MSCPDVPVILSFLSNQSLGSLARFSHGWRRVLRHQAPSAACPPGNQRLTPSIKSSRRLRSELYCMTWSCPTSPLVCNPIDMYASISLTRVVVKFSPRSVTYLRKLAKEIAKFCGSENSLFYRNFVNFGLNFVAYFSKTKITFSDKHNSLLECSPMASLFTHGVLSCMNPFFVWCLSCMTPLCSWPRQVQE